MRFRRLWLLIVALLLLPACRATPQAAEGLEPFTFMAGYKPQANLPFVGVYVAQAQGYFAEVGLDVTIRHSGGQGEHLQLLTAGEVDVTTQDAAILLRRRVEPGLPLVSIALIGQRGQQAYVALAESGIETVQDWAGRSVGYKGTPPPDLFALLHAAGLTPDDVALINVGFDPRVLVEGLIDVYPVFNSNEPYLLTQWGYALNQWEAADYGVPSLGLTYVATETGIAQHPERMAAFVRAALRGMDYAAAHPEEAIEIVLQYTGPETDPAHMRFMLETELADAYLEGAPLGWQTAAQWQSLADMLLDYDLISAPVDVTRAFTNAFVEAAQQE